MFENLTSKIESAFSFFSKSTQLDEKQVDEGLRKIRQALLESDVALSVAKEFIANVKPKAIGQEVLKSITPGQLLVKIVYDELVKILGSEKSEAPPSINPDDLAEALLKLESGEELDADSAELITNVVNKLKSNPEVEEVIDNGLDLLDLKKKQFDLLLKRI